jgi:hypothetical protein
VAYNRIQNPLLQDRVHQFLGIKGAGSAAPTLSSEVVPVVIIGDVGLNQPGPQFRNVVVASRGTTNNVNAFWKLRFLNPLTNSRQIRIIEVAFQLFYPGANGSGLCTFGFDRGSAAVSTGFEAITGEHLASTSSSGSSGFHDYQDLVAASAINEPFWFFTIPVAEIITWRPNDLVLKPGDGLGWNNTRTFGATPTVMTRWEWIEEPLGVSG